MHELVSEVELDEIFGGQAGADGLMSTDCCKEQG
jgi:hypothetical protein